MRLLARLIFLMFITMANAAAQGIYLIPSGPIVADGKQTSTLHFWIPSLVETDKIKIKPATGKVTRMVRASGNVVTIDWAPARESATREIPVTVSIRRRGVAPLTASPNVVLIPPTEGSISVKATPGEWAPNQGDIQVKLTLNGTSPKDVGARRVLVSASVGSVSEAVPLGDGTFSARWTPPADNEVARTVVISAVDTAAPSTVFGWTSFPMLANQSLSFGATPDSQNVLVIGDREYGPVKASPSGTVAFSALAHPRIRQGILRSTLKDGRTLDVPAPLKLTEYPRVSFLPQPRSVPAGATHDVLLVATTPEGDPLNDASITIRANASALGEAVSTTSPGVYALRLTPDQASTTVLEAVMKDPAALVSGQQKAKTVLNVVPALPSVSLEAAPSPFPAGTKQVVLSATVQDPSGASTAGPASFINTGSRILGRPAAKGSGRYDLKIRPETGVLHAAAIARMSGSAGTPAALHVWPATHSVLPGREVPVLVSALDPYGHPVPDVEIKLTTPAGGTITADVKTGPSGIGHAIYTASGDPGVFTIRAAGAGLSTDGWIFQGDASAAPGPLLSGRPQDQAMAGSVQKAVGTIRVEMEAAPEAPPLVAPAPVVAASSPTPPPAVASPSPQPPTSAAPSASTSVEAATQSRPTQPAVPQAPPAPASFAGSTSQVYAALLGSHHRFNQTADVAEGELSPLPPVAEFNRAMSPGIRIGGDYWLNDGPLSITGDLRLTMEKVAAGGRVVSYSAWSVQVGAKYKLAEQAFGRPYVLGTVQRAHNSLFKFRDETMTTMRATHQSLVGARVGAGVVRDIPAAGVSLDLYASELLNPMPIMTNVGAVATREVAPDISAMMGLELFHKHVALKSSGTDVDISDLEISLLAGVTYAGF